MKQVQSQRSAWIRILVFTVLLACVVLFLNARKDKLLNDFTKVLSAVLARQTDLEIEVGKTTGHFFGWISLQDVTIQAPWLPQDNRLIFRAKEIQFRYRLWDFIAKQFDSSIQVFVKRPELFWHPHFGLRKPEFPFLDWLQNFALSQEKHLLVRIEDMRLKLSSHNLTLDGIDVFYKDAIFRVEVPVSHLEVGAMDVSSTLRLEGSFTALASEHGTLKGRVRTEGTVVNWKPIDEESQFEFIFTPDLLELRSVSFLGGVEVEGSIDLTHDYELTGSLRAKNYPLAKLDPFSASSGAAVSPGRLDIDARFTGSVWAPQVEMYSRLHQGSIGKRSFKAMDLHVEGSFPTVRLTDSRIILEDGSVMLLAERTLDVRDLLKEKTYTELVSDTIQETVVWGDWELSRSQTEKDKPEFRMERVLGDKASVHLRKWNEGEDSSFRQDDDQDMEVGFEYRLRSKDTLKVELRENEEFVGVERKMKF